MPYLIDGHNLIPKVPGLSLRAVDDEQQLIERLQLFCQQKRTEVHVYFDKAPPGMAGTRRHGRLTAHFVREGRTADEAIEDRLRKLGRAARNWTVVSSDGRVQAAAREAHAQVLSSEDFARQLNDLLSSKGGEAGSREDLSLGPDEVEEWLRIFQGRRKRK